MKIPQIAVVVIALAVGFFAGRNSTVGSFSNHSGPSEISFPGSSTASRSNQDETSTISWKRTRNPQRPEAKSSDPASVMIPLDTISTVAKERLLFYQNFENIPAQLDDLLKLLGCSNDERLAVTNLMEATRQEILNQEQKRLKITRADRTGVTIDMSGMIDPIQQITSRTQAQFGKLLSPEIARALNDSIDWDNFYFRRGESKLETTFKITRGGENGQLAAVISTEKGWWRTTLESERYAEYNEQIPAALVFGTRWAPYLEKITLVPAN